jgi:hypothetical protein
MEVMKVMKVGKVLFCAAAQKAYITSITYVTSITRLRFATKARKLPLRVAAVLLTSLS